MANATPTRLGANLGAAANYAQINALFEQLYLTEVHAAYLEANIMEPLHMTRTISHGKSASFPRIWKTSAQYHTPGTELLGTNSVEHTEKIIYVDERLASDIFVADIDEMKNHYDVRAEYARQQGHALAKAYDVNVIRNIVLAARATPDFDDADTDTPTDRVIDNAALATDGDTILASLWTAAEKLDVANVPDMDRYAVFAPAQYYLLFQTTGMYPLNRDWGGAGSIQDASLPRIANFGIRKSNHMTATALGGDYAGTTGENNTYSGDYSGTVGIAFHKAAVGTVKLRDLAFRVTPQPAKYGDLLQASYIVGHGDLRPEGAIELATAEA